LVGTTLLNVHFSGHQDILINNNVAKLPLEVDLFLRGTLNRPLLFGRVEAPRGSFRFRKNEFTLSSASVEFLNPDRIAPQFDLKAKTSLRSGLQTPVDYAINLSLAGNFDRFTMSLSSTPSLPEPDILSLLTVGKTTEEIGQGGTSVSGEAVSFVVSEFLEEPVSGLTGIDQFQVAPSTDENARTATEVTIGKRLMEDRLLVTYKTTLDPSQEQLVRMEYELNENISLVGQRDKEGRIGGDIKFRFEFR
jgi:translocation and assembly module TamB